MKISMSSIAVLGAGGWLAAQAAVITVTTALNADPPPGATSLLQALGRIQDGDEIRFDIPGAGPHFLETPPGGYPLITRRDVRIDGYSQPGSAPNTHSILASNNARIRIVLDSRNGQGTPLGFGGGSPYDDTGYYEGERCVLGFVGATGWQVRGLCILGVASVPPEALDPLYGVALGWGASGQICGCWIGVGPDGRTLAGPRHGIAGYRYVVRDENLDPVAVVLADDVVVGVAPKAADAPAQFNVIAGVPGVPVLIEGNRCRVSGNYLQVLPDGLTDYNPALDASAAAGLSGGAVQIGRGCNGAVIGVDGDGVNDAEERNVMGGGLPSAQGGYDHTLEFYLPAPGTNIVIAGNYIGVGIDGTTHFTNGVAPLNAAGPQAIYRFGSNRDGVSDDLEGNRVCNYHPPTLFPPEVLGAVPALLSFLDEVAAGTIVSLRGNTLVNNLPFPSSPVRDDGAFLEAYYAKALANPADGVVPVLSSSTTNQRLIGRVPLAAPADWPETIIDLYVADPVGLTNGVAAGVVALPFGFVQGRDYVASFVENGPADQDPEPGGFSFDLTGIRYAGTNLTITANYVGRTEGEGVPVVLTSPFSNPVVVDPPAVLDPAILRSLRWANGAVTVDWEGGTPPFALERQRVLGSGGWENLATTLQRTATVEVTGATGFFRVRSGATGP